MLVALARSSAASAQAELPRNVGQLYRRFIDEYVFKEREPQRGHIEYDYSGVKRPVLAWLAGRMTSANTTVIRHDRGLEGETEGELERALEESRRLTTRHKFVPAEWDAAGFLEEVIANAILRSNDGNLEFMHESVQEYFTVVELKVRPAEAAARARPLVWRHLEVDRMGDARAEDPYRVPLLMLTGLLETSDALVQALAAREPLLAAECVRAAGSVEPSTRARLRDEWFALLDRAHERYRRVGTAASQRRDSRMMRSRTGSGEAPKMLSRYLASARARPTWPTGRNGRRVTTGQLSCWLATLQNTQHECSYGIGSPTRRRPGANVSKRRWGLSTCRSCSNK